MENRLLLGWPARVSPLRIEFPHVICDVTSSGHVRQRIVRRGVYYWLRGPQAGERSVTSLLRVPAGILREMRRVSE